MQVFTPSTPEGDIQAAVDAAFSSNGGDCDLGQFGSNRYAFLFAPGSYSTDVPVGFYTSIYGLGSSPSSTTFTGDKGVYTECGW